MIDPDHERPSIRRQCELVSNPRVSFYGQPAGETLESRKRPVSAAGGGLTEFERPGGLLGGD